MGLTSRVGCVGASSGTVEALESQLQTRMLTLIFVFLCIFLRFGSDFGMILDGFGARKSDFLHSFFENVDSRKSCSRRSEIAIFKVSGLMKTTQNPCKIVFEKSLQKSDPKK